MYVVADGEQVSPAHLELLNLVCRIDSLSSGLANHEEGLLW